MGAWTSDFSPDRPQQLPRCRWELLETVASGRSSYRRVWQTRDTYPVYGEHRRREIRPRSRFI